MKKIIERDYVLDEGIIVIHHTLDALYQKYCYCIPKEIERKLLDLVVETADLLNYPKEDEIKDTDIKKEDYVRRVKYTNKKRVDKSKNML